MLFIVLVIMLLSLSNGYNIVKVHKLLYINKKSLHTRHVVNMLTKYDSIDNGINSLVKVNDDKAKNDYLFGNNVMSFGELGLHESIVKALNNLGFNKATSIQSKALPVIMNGTDVVIGAETGSGKTLAYLLPIFHKCLNVINTKQSDEINLLNEFIDVNSSDYKQNSGYSFKYPTVVILLPNKELCNQVFEVATNISNHIDNFPLTIGLAPLPGSRSLLTDILICTPSYLTKYFKGSRILDEKIFKSIKYLVLDEADMLLEGSYQQIIEDLQAAFKVIRRQMIHDGEIKVHEDILQHILVAATIPTYGVKSIHSYITQRFPKAKRITQEYLHEHHPRIQQNFINVNDSSVLSDERLTLLVNAIKQTFPTNPSYPLTNNDDIPSTMVFVNTAQTAKDLCKLLNNKSNIKCIEYHKLVADYVKSDNYNMFKNGLVKVLICTDAAARGLDLPNVKHVIQAEFALNVVQHQHRIGRASRAGNAGYATNFYDSTSTHLINNLLDTTVQDIIGNDTNDGADSAVSEIVTNKSVSKAFSRRRGLRQKQKKLERRALEYASVNNNETVDPIDELFDDKK